MELATAERASEDFPPEEKIARDKLIALLTSLFERFGFNPLGDAGF
jgi:histidyl-tRNA synthetase